MSDTIKAIEQFFNDIVAQVIPGSILIMLSSFFLGYQLPDNSLTSLIFLGMSYLAGHIVLAVDESIRLLLSNTKSFLRESKNESEDAESKLKAVDVFITLMGYKAQSIDVSKLSINDQRSLAMSVSKEAADIGRRFMFISLSCKSTEILLIFLVPIFVQFELSKIKAVYELDISVLCHTLVLQCVCMLLTICIIYPLEKRANAFKRRAENVPFSAAVAQLLTEK